MTSTPTTHPIQLSANQPADRFYRGGPRIAAFRGGQVAAGAASQHVPEDWVGSTTTVRGQFSDGLTRLPDGALLVDAIAADPIGWLGAAHIARYGADMMLLVKLLDAGQRLPVHAHPDGMFAATHVGAAHGKAEAWHILQPGTVYLGLQRPIADDALLALVEHQHVDELLGLLHPIAVDAHDTVYVPPGTLHAIGAGVLLAEVQEPEDLSILLEWTGFDLDGRTDGHLGLGFATALSAVDMSALSDDRLDGLIRHGDGPALPSEADRFFRLDRVRGPRTVPAGIAVVIGLEGVARMRTAGGVEHIEAGSTWLVPAAAGALEISGPGSALVARPPAA